MADTTKKCPMCAEEIPFDAQVCPYCDTRLNGEALPQARLHSVPPAAKPKHPGRGIGFIAAGLVILAIVAGIIWIVFRGGIAGLLPAEQPDFAATQQKGEANATASAQDSWVQGFAAPIRAQIEYRSPDFSDDFSNKTRTNVLWNLSPGIVIDQGLTYFTADGDHAYLGIDGPLNSTNFVLEFQFTPQSVDEEVWIGVSFRAEGDDYNHFTLSIGYSPESWYGFGKNDAQGLPGILAEGDTLLAGLGQTTKEMVIVRGQQAALYLNDQPVLYTEDLWESGSYVGLGITSVLGESIVVFDNVRFWDLNK